MIDGRVSLVTITLKPLAVHLKIAIKFPFHYPLHSQTVLTIILSCTI